MPGFNRRGPRGEGPRTGRGKGRCNDASPNRSNQKQETRDANTPENQAEKNMSDFFGLKSGLRRRTASGRSFRNRS